MSTTAGVAAQQYVAINGTSVVALVLAAVSLWFGLMAPTSTLWLVIPVAGILCGIVAWRQISDSNGTEKGKAFAAIGLLGCLAIGAIVITLQVQAASRAREDGRQMSAIVGQLFDDVRADKAKNAYQRFSANFRARVPEDLFVTRWEQIQDPRAYGKLQSLTWNGVPPAYDTAEGGDVTMAIVSVTSVFDRAEPRYTFVFRQAGDTWQLENIPEMFPNERKDPTRK